MGHEPLRRLHRPDRQQPELGRNDGHVDQHQPDRSEVSDADAGATCRRWCPIRSSASRPPARWRAARRSKSGQLLRPFPQFLNVNMKQSTGAHSQYHAAIFQLRKRVDRDLGRRLQLHLQPAERQSVRAEQLLFELARAAEQLHVVPGLAVLQPGCGVRPKPARLAAQDRHRAARQCCRSARARSSCRTAASATCCSAAGRSRRSITMQSGFPIGVSQNTTGTIFLYRRHGPAEHRARPAVPRRRRHHRSHHARTRTTTCI